MTSKTGGSACPPYRFGQERPKKPASYSEVCHSACRAQYSSSVDETGRPGLFSASHARRRALNSASAGESRKSIGCSESRPLQTPQLLAVVAEPLRREQRAAEVDVDDTIPRVAHSAVHLHGRLADGARSACAIGLRDAPGDARGLGLELVDR